jgi:hypothetical protein
MLLLPLLLLLPSAAIQNSLGFSFFSGTVRLRVSCSAEEEFNDGHGGTANIQS